MVKRTRMPQSRKRARRTTFRSDLKTDSPFVAAVAMYCQLEHGSTASFKTAAVSNGHYHELQILFKFNVQARGVVVRRSVAGKHR